MLAAVEVDAATWRFGDATDKEDPSHWETDVPDIGHVNFDHCARFPT